MIAVGVKRGRCQSDDDVGEPTEPWAKGMLLEAEIDEGPFTDMIFPAEVYQVHADLEQCYCRLQPFDAKFKDSFDTWPWSQLHRLRQVKLPSPHQSWTAGDEVHICAYPDVLDGLDYIIWQKARVVGQTENPQLYQVSFREWNGTTMVPKEQTVNVTEMRSAYGTEEAEEAELLCMYCFESSGDNMVICDGEDCNQPFHPSCAGYEEALAADPVYRGHQVTLNAYCKACLKEYGLEHSDIVSQQEEYRQLERCMGELWMWIPIDQDGKCAFGCIWKWLQMHPHLLPNPFASFEDMIRRLASAAIGKCDGGGSEKRAEVSKLKSAFKGVHDRPNSLAKVWQTLAVEYLWEALIDLLPVKTTIHLWHLHNGSLECKWQWPAAQEVAERFAMHVLQWNTNVAAHFDMLLRPSEEMLLTLDEGADIDAFQRSLPNLQAIVVNLTAGTWEGFQEVILTESAETLVNVANQGSGESLKLSARKLVERLERSPSELLYLRDLSVENLPASHQWWLRRFNDLLGVNSPSHNLLRLLHTPRDEDERDCRYLNAYFYAGGKETFCALHRDTLGMPAGNIVLKGCKEWTFLWGGDVCAAVGGPTRLAQEQSVPDLDWLSAQPGVHVLTTRVGPGQLILVNSQRLHMVTNVGPGITTSVAWSMLPPTLLSEAWDQMHRNRQMRVASKVLLQELVSRREERGACWDDLMNAQQYLFSMIPKARHEQCEELKDFLYCDICLGEIWNAHLECQRCEGMLICAFCFRDAPHSQKHVPKVKFQLELA